MLSDIYICNLHSKRINSHYLSLFTHKAIIWVAWRDAVSSGLLHKKKHAFKFLCSRNLCKRKTSLEWLTAVVKEKSNRSPPAAARSDGAMLLWPPVVVLSSWRMKRNSTVLDIYLNKVLGSLFDKGFKCKHPTQNKAVTQMSNNNNFPDMTGSVIDSWSWAIRTQLSVTVRQTVYLHIA